MFDKRRHRAPDPRAEGLQQISDWKQWFLDAHAERLSRPDEFPDRDLVEQERATIAALADAIAARMTSDFLARTTP